LSRDEYPSPAQENLTFVMVGTWWSPETLMGDRYLREVGNVDVMNVSVIGAQISFRYKRAYAGIIQQCWHPCSIPTTIWLRELPTGYLSVGLKS